MIDEIFYKGKTKWCSIVCGLCGKKFERQLCNVKKKEIHFCSRYCSGLYVSKLAIHPNHSAETKVKMSNSHIILNKKGSKSHMWKTGRMMTSTGYLRIYRPEHPNARHGYVFEHRLMMEKILGRYLLTTEIVHHKNEIRDDNRIENLILFKNNVEHLKYHFALKRKEIIGE